MFRAVAAIALLICLASGAASSPPEVQPEFKTIVGQNLRIVVKGKDVDYKTTFTDEEAFFDQLTSPKEGELRFVFQAPKDGVFYITFWTTGEKGSGTVVKITVGNPIPPKPPTPPTPPGPAPSEELKQKIKEAFIKDKGEKADAIQLAALYREVSKLSTKKTAGVYEAPSSRELLRRMRETSSSLIGPDTLVEVRIVASTELATIFGTLSDDPLTDKQRNVASDTFLKLASALESVSN